MAGRRLADRGAEAVLLGGTDLFLAFTGHDCGFPVIDCADVHVDAIYKSSSEPPPPPRGSGRTLSERWQGRAGGQPLRDLGASRL